MRTFNIAMINLSNRLYDLHFTLRFQSRTENQYKLSLLRKQLTAKLYLEIQFMRTLQ